MKPVAWIVIALVAAGDAAAQVERVELRIGEPICPLSVLAAEKALRGDAKFDGPRGRLVVVATAGRDLDPLPMPQAIRDAGLLVAEVRLTAIGTLVPSDQAPVLELDGPLARLVLTGGADLLEPLRSPALVGKRLRLSGTLARASGGRSPTLAVEEWAALPEAEDSTPAVAP